VRRAGARLYFDVVGQGDDTVVLAHPLAFTGRFFLSLAERAAGRGFRVVLPDSLGHGSSDKPSAGERYALRERVDDLLHICDAVGAERFGFVGYSMGGWLGTGLLARHPHRVSAAAIGGWDPVAGPPPGVPLALVDDVPIALRQLSSQPGATQAVASGDVEAVKHCFRALYEPLPAIDSDVPLLLWVAREDPYHPGVAAAASRLGARLVVLEGDHGTAALDEAVAAVVVEHLRPVS